MLMFFTNVITVTRKPSCDMNYLLAWNVKCFLLTLKKIKYSLNMKLLGTPSGLNFQDDF